MSEKFVDLGSKKWIHKTLAYLSSPETPTENSSVHRTQWISQRKLNILCVSTAYWCKIEYYVYIIQGTRSRHYDQFSHLFNEKIFLRQIIQYRGQRVKIEGRVFHEIKPIKKEKWWTIKLVVNYILFLIILKQVLTIRETAGKVDIARFSDLQYLRIIYCIYTHF